MKTSLISLLMASALAGPAAAFTAQPNWEVPEAISVVCIPEHIHGADPVVRTEVTANFIPATEAITNLTVVHELFSGVKRNRDNQYDADFLGQPKKGKAAWLWHGYLKTNRNQEMHGLLFYNGVWHYAENIKMHGRDVFDMNSTCHFYGELESEYEDKR
jgi:hypothetical protein